MNIVSPLLSDYLSFKMMESINGMPQGVKWPFRFIILFVFIMILGFIPWEPMLSIQIRDNILKWLTGSSMGLLGLLGLSCTIIICIRHKKDRFSIVSVILLGFLSILVSLLFILGLVLPTFEWHDTYVYRNGNEYIVVQEQESFVTSNQTNSRVIRTASPYGVIRKVEELVYLKDNEDHIGGNEVIYKGKIWYKEPRSPTAKSM